jgi:hypothetical protein
MAASIARSNPARGRNFIDGHPSERRADDPKSVSRASARPKSLNKVYDFRLCRGVPVVPELEERILVARHPVGDLSDIRRTTRRGRLLATPAGASAGIGIVSVPAIIHDYHETAPAAKAVSRFPGG